MQCFIFKNEAYIYFVNGSTCFTKNCFILKNSLKLICKNMVTSDIILL